jgi:ribosomal protein S25
MKYENNRFNPATYMVIDRITGEEVPIQIFIEQANCEYWEKAYAKTLAEYIGIVGVGSSNVLAFIIKNKQKNNLLVSTFEEIAKKSNVARSTVDRIFKELKKRGFIKKVRNGCYMVSPKLLVHGSKTHGAMLLRIWGEI